MDIKAKIEELAEKIMKDTKLRKQFKTEPIKAIEELVGVDLPDEMMEKIVKGVQAKISADQVSDALGKLKKLF